MKRLYCNPSPSQAQNETRLTVSTPPAGSLMLDKATPCESCCSEGTRQRHHYRFPHYPHPRQVQNHPQGLQEAHPVGRSQSKFHSLKLYSHQNQHHRDYRQVLQEEHRDNQLFSWAKLPATIIGWSFVWPLFSWKFGIK